MRRLITSLGLGCFMLIVPSGAALAGCAESIGLLAKQVTLIGDASALAADPNTPLGPGDTLITLEKPALKSRTAEAFDVFETPQPAAGDTADWGFSANLARARESLDNARTALDRGDTPACEEAITVGLAAAHRARAWLTRGAGSS